jgi:hypothetical protein
MHAHRRKRATLRRAAPVHAPRRAAPCAALRPAPRCALRRAVPGAAPPASSLPVAAVASLRAAAPVAEAELELRPGPLMREAGKGRPRRGGGRPRTPRRPQAFPVAVPLAAVASLRAAAPAAG